MTLGTPSITSCNKVFVEYEGVLSWMWQEDKGMNDDAILILEKVAVNKVVGRLRYITITYDDGYKKVKYSDGDICWFYDGLLHRDNGPAVIRPDGTKLWYKNGERYLANKPSDLYEAESSSK